MRFSSKNIEMTNAAFALNLHRQLLRSAIGWRWATAGRFQAQNTPAVGLLGLRSFNSHPPTFGTAHAILKEDDVVDALNSYGSVDSATFAPSTESQDGSKPGTFAAIPALSEPTLRALRHDFKYTEMSPVQDAVLSLLPTEKDLLVRAKTGTGKTLAFLIAAVESAIARRKGKRFDGNKTTIIVLSPTRELALQIGNEAARLLKPHMYRVQTAVGGPGRNRMVQILESQRVDVLVGTPGRMLDMLENVPAFRKKCQGLQTVRNHFMLTLYAQCIMN